MPIQSLNGVDLYYERVGSGPPLLFIHGLGSSTRDWEYQAPFFASRFSVICVDLRGHGGSAKPPGPYRIAGFAADVAGLLRALDVAPAHVVGLSLGGMVALELALCAPELVRSLTIVNSGPALPTATRRERLLVGLIFLQRLLIVRLFGMRKMGETLASRLFPDTEQADLRRSCVERWARNDPQAYLAALRAIGGWSVMERLGELRCPTLVATADQDYTPLDFKQAYCARIPNAELAVIANSRHMTPIDQPVAFNRTVLEFLEKR